MQPPPEVAAERTIDAALVRRLLAAQRPAALELSQASYESELAALEIRRVAEGWDNVLLRVGARWLARVPRRAVAAELLRGELRCLPALAPSLPLPVPAAAYVGRPEDFFPWPWALVPWIEGTPLGHALELDHERVATQLGRFLGALHRLPLPADAPSNAMRGVPLRTRAPLLEERLARLRALGEPLDEARLRARWREFASQPEWPGPKVWCHGDLHPFNLLTRGGQLAAVLDWGDVHGGDPALDLASAWMASPRARHSSLRAAYGAIDDTTWLRGQGWAVYYGVTLLDAGLRGAGPPYASVGRRTLARALAG
ncbi:MAG: aminoglycoside phosphotransferase family protein [Myxococcales bacterium]|nr:aminoglycoside phosphotransferase family protein [Myxococcales bacterium]